MDLFIKYLTVLAIVFVSFIQIDGKPLDSTNQIGKNQHRVHRQHNTDVIDN